MPVDFFTHFSAPNDPRDDKNKLHALLDILFLTIAAVVSGAAGWEAIEEFGKAKIEWLRRFLPFTNGVPSHDRIRVVMISLSPKGLQSCFANWISSVAGALPGEIIAIDGKTVRRSYAGATTEDRSTWSAPGPRPTGGVLAKSRRTPSRMRSRPSPNSLNCWNSGAVS